MAWPRRIRFRDKTPMRRALRDYAADRIWGDLRQGGPPAGRARPPRGGWAPQAVEAAVSAAESGTRRTGQTLNSAVSVTGS